MDWEEGGERQKGQLQSERGSGTPGKSVPPPQPCVTLGISPLSVPQCPHLYDILSWHRIIVPLLR